MSSRRRAELEIEQHQPASPTLYVVASGVTLNRPEEDSELLCGLYVNDYRTGAVTAEYVGLGDDPTRYRVRHDDWGRLHVSED